MGTAAKFDYDKANSEGYAIAIFKDIAL